MRAPRFKTGSVVRDKRRGVWYWLQWVDGKRRTKTIGSMREYPTKSKAQRAVERLRETQALEAPGTSAAPTVRTLVEQYRAEKMPQRYTTRRSYDVWLRLYILPRWGDSHITELQAYPVETWLKSLDMTPRSKSSIRFLVRVLWDFAMWRADVPVSRNPMELVTIPGATKRTRKPSSLTVDEFRKLLTHLEDPFRTMALVCVCFGLRVSECLALKFFDVDWLNSRLHVQRSIVRQRVGDTKTEYSERAMPIDVEMLAVLKNWRQSSQFQAETDWVFASPAHIGRLPWSADSLNDAYRKAGQASGVLGVSTHTMRHTYRSWLDAVGTPIAVQQKLMRHADIRTTMNVYGDVVTDEMRQAHSRVVGLALNGLQADCKPS